MKAIIENLKQQRDSLVQIHEETIMMVDEEATNMMHATFARDKKAYKEAFDKAGEHRQEAFNIMTAINGINVAISRLTGEPLETFM